MALFFDAQWFDVQLAARGLSRADAAKALGLDAAQIADLWKDQRELSVQDVRVLARLIGSSPGEVAGRAGVSTPVPVERPEDMATAIAELGERLARVERAMLELKALILDLRQAR